MKLDVTKTITNIDGKPFKDGESDLQLKHVLASCLLSPGDGRKKDSIKESMQKNHLAEKIWQATGEVDLKIDDLKLLKDSAEEHIVIPRVKAVVGMMLEV